MEVEGYLINNYVDENYQNYKWKLEMRNEQSVYDLRQKISEEYGWDSSSFVLTWVHNKQLKKILNWALTIKELKELYEGVLMCYVIPPELNPSLPDKSKLDKFDSNYGLGADWVKVPIHIRKNGMREYFNLPRLIWVKKARTLV